MPARWSEKQRALLLHADLAKLREEKVTVMRRLETHLQDEIRGLEIQYTARTAADRDRQEITGLEQQINDPLEALHELIPKPRKPED
jgi:hypothetical protein